MIVSFIIIDLIFWKFLALTRLFYCIFIIIFSFKIYKHFQTTLSKFNMSKETNITVTGVDIGSANVKIAAVVKGGV